MSKTDLIEDPINKSIFDKIKKIKLINNLKCYKQERMKNKRKCVYKITI